MASQTRNKAKSPAKNSLMPGSAASNSTSTSKQPRAQLIGTPPSQMEELQAQMPYIEDVRREAEKALEYIDNPVPPNVHISNTQGENLGVVHPSVGFHHMFPKLFKFSWLCHEDDVPEDILHVCLWALRQRVKAIEEASDRQLRTLIPGCELDSRGFILPEVKDRVDAHTRIKLIAHCLKPEINEPEESVKHFETGMNQDEILGLTETCLGRPESDAQYGAALARTKTRDKDAKRVLERVTAVLEKDLDEQKSILRIQSRLYLSRVLRRLGDLDEAEKGESYLVRWFRKNPTQIPDKFLRQWFETEDDDDPVYKKLGGEKWFKKKRKVLTSKSFARQTRLCYQCGAAETMEKKLMKCSKCQTTVYCSRQCQKAHFPYHKITCIDRSLEHAKVANLREEGSDTDAKCVADWNNYKRLNFDGNNTCYHALGLHHSLSRGSTHVLVKKIRWVPDGGKELLHRFEVTEAGVFKIDQSFLGLMDVIMGDGLRGTTEHGMAMLKQDFLNGPGKRPDTIPFFTILISDDPRLMSYVNVAGVLSKAKDLLPHDPNWRSQLNVGKSQKVAKPLKLEGLQDAEYDYLSPEDLQLMRNTNGSVPSNDNNSTPSKLAEAKPTEGASSDSTAKALPRLRGMFNKK